MSSVQSELDDRRPVGYLDPARVQGGAAGGKSGLRSAPWWVTPTDRKVREQCNRKQTADRATQVVRGKGETVR